MHIQEIKQEIKFDFEPSTESPSRIFRSIEDLLTDFESINIETVKCVDPLIEINFFLEEVSTGSIIIKILKRILTPDTEDSLAAPEITGNLPLFLEKAQNVVVGALVESSETEIDNESIHDIVENIHREAVITGVNKSGNYRRINSIQVADRIQSIGNTYSNLKENEGIILPFNDLAVKIKKPKTNINIQDLKKELVDRVIENTTTQILMIKIVDFLGKTKWKFKIGDETLDAKILDTGWLTRFHKKEDQIGPGDSIEAQILQKDYYDKYGRKFDSESFIVKVLSIKEGVIENDLAI